MKAQKTLRALLAFLALVLAVAAPLALPAPAAADGSGWQGDYFNNMYLWGAPSMTRIDSAINFNWGASAPDPRIPADGFSVRWTRSVGFEAGRYRFNVESDDGIRLYLDGALILDQWRDQSATSYSVERLLSAGEHYLRVEYYEHRGDAVARVWWERLGEPTITEWRGEYFNNMWLAGAPSVVRNDATIDFDWGAGAPAAGIAADGFSARWSRTLNFAAGRYRFTAVADDGVRLYIDGALVINQWRDQAATPYTLEQNLTGGNHTIVMEYYENTGNAVARLQWQPAGVTPPPTPAPGPSAYWRGEYFSNPTLSGAPALVRNDLNIDFRWEGESPDWRIPSDRFSARWERSLYFPAGRYRFFGSADDGVRLYIDGTRVVDQWREQSEISYGVTRDLSAGSHTITLEYFENAGRAVITLDWQLVGGASPMSAWRGEYFNNTELAGAPVFVRNDSAINFRWGYGSPDGRLPADYFSARWMRVAQFSAGRYVFSVRSDDGVRLAVDGRVVLNEWRDMSDSTFNVPVRLNAGLHMITLEYYERTGNALVELSWRGPLELPSGGNLVTCIAPTNSWLKAYQLTGDGTWLDINPRGWGPIAANGYLKIDGLPVDYQRWGAAGNPYRIEVWRDGHIIRSVGNTAAGEPEWRLRPNADNYTPWGCPVW